MVRGRRTAHGRLVAASAEDRSAGAGFASSFWVCMVACLMQISQCAFGSDHRVISSSMEKKNAKSLSIALSRCAATGRLRLAPHSSSPCNPVAAVQGFPPTRRRRWCLVECGGHRLARRQTPTRAAELQVVVVRRHPLVAAGTAARNSRRTAIPSDGASPQLAAAAGCDGCRLRVRLHPRLLLLLVLVAAPPEGWRARPRVRSGAPRATPTVPPVA